MDLKRRETIASLFEVVTSLERKWANEWNALNDSGFSKSHIQILKLLALEGPKRPSNLAEKLRVTTGGVTVLTTKLMNAGLIEKTQSATDRRSAQIAITPKGLEQLEQSQQQLDAIVERMFGMLSHEEIESLHNIIYKCLDDKK